MILCVDAQADGLPLVPLVGKWFGEERIDLEPRYFHHRAFALSFRHPVEHALADAQRDNQHDEYCPGHHVSPSVHTILHNSLASKVFNLGPVRPCPC